MCEDRSEPEMNSTNQASLKGRQSSSSFPDTFADVSTRYETRKLSKLPKTAHNSHPGDRVSLLISRPRSVFPPSLVHISLVIVENGTVGHLSRWPLRWQKQNAIKNRSRAAAVVQSFYVAINFYLLFSSFILTSQARQAD